MSKAAKRFREELAAKAPLKVWVVLDGANATRIEREAVVTTGGMFVQWPMCGLYRVLADGYLSPPAKRWRVCAEDFAELLKRRAILLDEKSHFLPVTGSVFP